MKFTRDGSVSMIVDYAKDNGGQLTIAIKDTGMGIAPDELPLLFSRFGKLHRTASSNHEGIGLGLNIVK